MQYFLFVKSNMHDFIVILYVLTNMYEYALSKYEKYKKINYFDYTRIMSKKIFSISTYIYS